MEGFLIQVGAWLIQQGAGYIFAGVEGLVIWYLFDRLIKNYEARINDKNVAADAANKRAEILERIAQELLDRRKR